MRRKLNTLVTIICLFATSVVTIATSKKKEGDDALLLKPPAETLARRNWLVASNCPFAIQQEMITVENEMIQYPPNLNFTHFGLPNETLNIMLDSQTFRIINGVDRDCRSSKIVHQGTPLYLFTCTQNGAPLCQVSFEEAQ